MCREESALPWHFPNIGVEIFDEIVSDLNSFLWRSVGLAVAQIGTLDRTHLRLDRNKLKKHPKRHASNANKTDNF